MEARFTRRAATAILLRPLFRAPAQSEWLQPILRRVCAESRIPGIQAIALTSQNILEKASSGVRHYGSDENLSLKDYFHIGSITKAMTTIMIARLIERGKLTWESRPLDVFPDLKTSVHESYRDATIDDFLNWRAGIAPFTLSNSVEFKKLPHFSGSPLEQRRQFTRYILAEPPAYAPRSKTVYSNASYGVAGAMAEAVTGLEWTRLMMQEVFEPMHISAHFSWPAARDKMQPWGHYEQPDGGLQRQDPNGPYQLPPFLQPGGDVSMRIEDYGTFLRTQLLAEKGECALLKCETFRRLHTPPDGVSGYGWDTPPDKKSQRHSGSAGTFYAVGRFWPSQDLAAAVFTNSGGDRAQKACRIIMGEIGRHHGAPMG